jgi:hypothetical protein
VNASLEQVTRKRADRLKSRKPDADAVSVHLARPRPALVLLCGFVLAAGTVPLLVSGSGDASTLRNERVLRVTERDFHISAPNEVTAGNVDLTVHNDGPDTHELIVVRANGKPLPLRRDGLTVDEEALRPRTVATFEGSSAGGGRSEQVHLPPGTYVLFCNMAGHYLGGMHTTLVVK